MNRPCSDCPLKGGKCGTCGSRKPVTGKPATVKVKRKAGTKATGKTVRHTETHFTTRVSISVPRQSNPHAQTIVEQRSGWTVYDPRFTVSADGTALIRRYEYPETQAQMHKPPAPPKVRVTTPGLHIQTQAAQPPKPPSYVDIKAPDMPLWMTMGDTSDGGELVQRLLALPEKIIRCIAERVQLALPAAKQMALPEHKGLTIMVVSTTKMEKGL